MRVAWLVTFLAALGLGVLAGPAGYMLHPRRLQFHERFLGPEGGRNSPGPRKP
jgi:hypothetical protein